MVQFQINELYRKSDSLPEGKEDKNLIKKPDIALKLVNQTIKRKYRPGIVLIDREEKGWLGLKDYQMRNKESLIRHFILVFTA
jgi:hypothetical protein